MPGLSQTVYSSELSHQPVTTSLKLPIEKESPRVRKTTFHFVFFTSQAAREKFKRFLHEIDRISFAVSFLLVKLAYHKYSANVNSSFKGNHRLSGKKI